MIGKLFTVGTAALIFATAANAETFEVQMLNRGETGAMVFEPAYVHAAVGDTVTFVATDKGHNAETIDGMIPDGAEEFEGKMGEDISVTLDQEGLYGIKCSPHYMLGMVALIQVGEATNLEEAEAVKQKGKAKQHFTELFEKVEQ